MNSVDKLDVALTEISLEDMTGSNFDSKKSAFVGTSSYVDGARLFLVTYSGISMAEQPRKTWTNPSVLFNVHQWVDVKITIV
jgi:hypothetical protein